MEVPEGKNPYSDEQDLREDSSSSDDEDDSPKVVTISKNAF